MASLISGVLATCFVSTNAGTIDKKMLELVTGAGSLPGAELQAEARHQAVLCMPEPLRKFVFVNPGQDAATPLVYRANGKKLQLDCIDGRKFSGVAALERHVMSSHANEYWKGAAECVARTTLQMSGDAVVLQQCADNAVRHMASLLEYNGQQLQQQQDRLAQQSRDVHHTVRSLMLAEAERQNMTGHLTAFFHLFDGIMHNLSVRGVQGRRFDDVQHALFLYIVNRGGGAMYNFLKPVLDAPHVRNVRELNYRQFADVGVSAEYAAAAKTFYDDYGLDVSCVPVSLPFDATKVVERYDYKMPAGSTGGGFIRGGDFFTAPKLRYDTLEDAQTATADHKPAGYCMALLVAPLLSAAASAIRVVGTIPTNLKYTAAQLTELVCECIANLVKAGFKCLVLLGADGDGRHRRMALEFLYNRTPQWFPLHSDQSGMDWSHLTGIMTMYPKRLAGMKCFTTMTSDVTHWCKKWSLAPLSMTRLLSLGAYPVLAMHLVACQLFRKVSGLTARDVNGADRMDYGSSARRLNWVVREAMRALPGTTGTIVYLFIGACMKAAMLDKHLDVATRFMLISRAAIFVRYWYAYIIDSEISTTHTIPMQLFTDTLIIFHAFLHRLAIHRKFFPDQPFCCWLDGSDQCECFFSEARGFSRTHTEFTVDELLSIVKRFHATYHYLSKPAVRKVLPPLMSAKGYNRSLYDPGFSSFGKVERWPENDELLAIYEREVRDTVQPLLEMLGMRHALESAGHWAMPPLENFDHVVKLTEEETEEDINGPAVDYDQLAAEMEQCEAMGLHVIAEGDEAEHVDEAVY